jgi:hypothetical protein
MNISPLFKWIVGIGAGLMTIVGAAKSLHDAMNYLNGWHVLFATGVLMLIAVGLDAYHAHIGKQLARISTAVATEAGARADAINSANQLVRDSVSELNDSIRDLKPPPQVTIPLRERVLGLRDEIQDFLKSVGDTPQTKRQPGMSLDEYQNAKIKDTINWQTKIEHVFARRFASRAVELFHECGEAGTSHTGFGIRLSKPPRTKADVDEVLSDLNWLAQNV